MTRQDFAIPDNWMDNLIDDKFICISTGDYKNLTIGKIYYGVIEIEFEEYLYVKQNDRGTYTMYPIEFFKLLSDDREDKINILLDI